MTANLVERRVYPTPPGDDLRSAFRKHVADTGQPETFPTISTTRPPTEGQVVALVHPVDINKAKRPSQAWAPCPICSPDSPKFLNKGTLIWCEATQAIYCIGPECSATLWGKGRLDRAVNLLKQTDRERSNAASLKKAVTAIAALWGWISAHRAAADRVSQLHAEFAKAAPVFRGTLSRWVKGNPRGQAIAGSGFLKATWRLGARLNEASDILDGLSHAAGADPSAWVDNLSPTAVNERLARFKVAMRALTMVRNCLLDASQFLTEANMKALFALSRAEDSPAPFTVSNTLAAATIKSREEVWKTSLGSPAPMPLPMV